MARINVEDDFWVNPGYRALTRFVGCEDKATGMCIRAWRVAQKYWGQKRLIPEDVWRIEGLESLIDFGLAERRAEGVYCRGSKDQFDWYHRLKDGASRGGQQSAKARQAKHGSAIPHNATNAPKPHRTKASEKTEAPSKPIRSDDRSPPNALTLTLTTTTENIPPGSAVWSAYSGSYFARYGVAPVRNAKSNGQCSQLVKRLGIDAAIGVVKFYLTHQQAYYVAKAHGLGPCLSDAEALHTQMLNGQKITRGSASQADSAAGNLQAFENVARKWAAKEREDKNEQAQNFDAAGNDGGTIG